MNEKELINLKGSITMPPETEAALLQSCAQPRRKHFRYRRYSAACAALIALVCIAAVGSTSYATYNAYQEKQLAIFMDADMTTEEKAALGEQLHQRQRRMGRFQGALSHRRRSARTACRRLCRQSAEGFRQLSGVRPLRRRHTGRPRQDRSAGGGAQDQYPAGAV